MDNLILPIFTLFIGWLLSESSQYFRRGDARKQVIRRALSDLLEIRHRVMGVQFILNEIEQRIELPKTALIQLRTCLPDSLKVDTKLSDRFNAALDELSSYDPFLAYRLRAKDIIGFIDKFMRLYSSTTESDTAELIYDAHEQLENMLLPHLDEIIKDTAWCIGFSKIDWFRATSHLKNSENPNEEVKKMMDDFIERLKPTKETMN